MNIQFISQKDLNRILNLRDVNKWNHIYQQHLNVLNEADNKNTFWHMIYGLYNELNTYVTKTLQNKIQYHNQFIAVSPKRIQSINKAFIKTKTKESLKIFFEKLGYDVSISNVGWDNGDYIFIKF